MLGSFVTNNSIMHTTADQHSTATGFSGAADEKVSSDSAASQTKRSLAAPTSIAGHCSWKISQHFTHKSRGTSLDSFKVLCGLNCLLWTDTAARHSTMSSRN
jgi:hypothetical protein